MTLQAQTIEGYDQTYGVGMPIILTFSHAVTNKAAVERSLQLRTSKPIVGAWYWDTSESLVFRTRTYWPQHTRVKFVAHLDGVETAPGVYGTANLSQSFEIGNSLIAVVSTTATTRRSTTATSCSASGRSAPGSPATTPPTGPTSPSRRPTRP